MAVILETKEVEARCSPAPTGLRPVWQHYKSLPLGSGIESINKQIPTIFTSWCHGQHTGKIFWLCLWLCFSLHCQHPGYKHILHSCDVMDEAAVSGNTRAQQAGMLEPKTKEKAFLWFPHILQCFVRSHVTFLEGHSVVSLVVICLSQNKNPLTLFSVCPNHISA